MMNDLTLLIPAKFEKESLPEVLKELSIYNCKKLIVLKKNDLETIKSIKGKIYQFNIAPPVKTKSVRFIANSILIIDIKLIPKAVLIAFINLNFCLNKITVSSAILVNKPLIIAKIIMPNTGKATSEI